MRYASSFLAGVVTCLVTTLCMAQAPVAPQGAAAAHELFVQGRELLEKGKVPAACAKLEESRKLDPSAMGTLFNLALCNERRARFATAFFQYGEVLAASRATRPDRAALAQERIKALEPRLSQLELAVPESSRIEGLSVALDGVTLPASSFGTSLKVDGGEHVVVASAPGYLSFTKRLTTPPERGAVKVALPRLERAPEPARPPPLVATATPTRDANVASTSSLGWILTAGGAAALAVGGGFGVMVLANVDEPNDPAKTADEQSSKYRELNTQAWIANVAIPLGAILVGTGVYLLLVDKSATKTARFDGRLRF